MKLRMPLEVAKLIDVFKDLHLSAMSFAYRVAATQLRRREKLKQTLTVSKVRVFYNNPDSFAANIYETPEALWL